MEQPQIPQEENMHKKESDTRTQERSEIRTVSVRDLISNINMEGLKVRNTNPIGTDEDESRKLLHLPHELSTTYASSLYLEELDDSEKSEAALKLQLKLKELDEQDSSGTVSKQFLESIEKNRSALIEIRKELRRVFEGQIVVDLAAGVNTFGYKIADQAHAKCYVALEPAFGSDLATEMYFLLNPENDSRNLAESQKERERISKKLNKIPAAIVKEDMLSFLRRLPANSVSVWCSGIDRIVLPDQEYRNEVVKEIVRVLHPQGAYVGQTKMSIEVPTSSEIETSFVGEKEKTGHSGEEEKGTWSSINIYRKKLSEII